MTSSERYQRPREIRRPMAGVRVLRAQLLPVPGAPAQAHGAVPARKNAKLAAGPASSSGKQVGGGASPASSKKKALGCWYAIYGSSALL